MFFYVLLILMYSRMISAGIGLTSCEKEDDCSKGHFCLEGICVKCIACSFLFRKGKNCVFDFIECGDCLPGYEEVSVTDSSSAIKPCKPVRLKTKAPICTTDDTCMPNSFCYENACVKCFNCSLVNRQSPEKGCAKLVSECGSCINGFSEVAVTIETNSKLCERQVSNDSKNITAKNKLINYNFIIKIFLKISAATVCLVIIVCFIVFSMKKQNKDHEILKNTCSKEPSAPPLQEIEPQPIVMQHEGREFPVPIFINYNETQQAKVFKEPTAPYYNFSVVEQNNYNLNQYLGITRQEVPSNSVPALTNDSPEERMNSVTDCSEVDGVNPARNVPEEEIDVVEPSDFESTDSSTENLLNIQPEINCPETLEIQEKQ